MDRNGNGIGINIEEDYFCRPTARRKRLHEATLLELIKEISRRLWRYCFCLRQCSGYLVSFCDMIWGRCDFILGTRWKRRGCSSASIDSDDQNILSQEQQERDEIDRNRRRINELQIQLNDQMHEYEQLQSLLEKTEMRLAKALSETDEMKKSKDDALSRLSEMMGVKLRDNNPAITDLNDPNRPMKLGEKFNELYENDWTDAFIKLQEMDGEAETSCNLSEEEVIEILLNILKEINQICCDEVNLHLTGMLNPIENLRYEDTTDFRKTMKDMYKSIAVKYAPFMYQKVIRDDSPCQTVTKYHTYCQTYIENCVNVCFLAAVQDPPMFLHFQPEEVYDKQIFKEYTAIGTRVRFLVWPALFLYRGGALLAKGVVQPMADDGVAQP